MSTPDRPAAGDNPRDEADEVLVAYLDGQLSSEECERVEALVADDPDARQRLQAFDRVWNALDALPQSTASPTFTRTTVDMVAVSAAKPALKRSATLRRLSQAWVAAISCGLLVGAAVAYGVARAPDRRAAADLPVALHATALEQAGSVEFLTKLASEADALLGPFQSQRTEDAAAQWEEVIASPAPERLEWVSGLAAAERASVGARVADFEARPREKRRSLRASFEAVDSLPNAAELRRVSLAYEAMVGRLPAGLQSEIRQMDIESRMRFIRRGAPRWAREAVFELNDDERQQMRAALEESVSCGSFAALVESRADELPPRLVESLNDRPKLAPFALTAMVAWSDRGPWRRSDRFGPLRERLQEIWVDWFEPILEAMPNRVRAEFADDSVEEQARKFRGLLRENADIDLSAVFGELPPDDVERMLLLPKDEFGAEVEEQAFGFFDLDLGRGRSSRGRGGPGPPGRSDGGRPSRRFGPPDGGEPRQGPPPQLRGRPPEDPR